MHFRILKVITTSGFLAALNCSKFVFGQEALQRSPRLPSWFKGDATSEGRIKINKNLKNVKKR